MNQLSFCAFSGSIQLKSLIPKNAKCISSWEMALVEMCYAIHPIPTRGIRRAGLIHLKATFDTFWNWIKVVLTLVFVFSKFSVLQLELFGIGLFSYIRWNKYDNWRVGLNGNLSHKCPKLQQLQKNSLWGNFMKFNCFNGQSYNGTLHWMIFKAIEPCRIPQSKFVFLLLQLRMLLTKVVFQTNLTIYFNFTYTFLTLSCYLFNFIPYSWTWISWLEW